MPKKPTTFAELLANSTPAVIGNKSLINPLFDPNKAVSLQDFINVYTPPDDNQGFNAADSIVSIYNNIDLSKSISSDTGILELDTATLSKAIATQEGWEAPDSRNRRNHNPGNLKFIGQAGAVEDSDGFAVFGTDEEGWAALENDIQVKKDTANTPSNFYDKYGLTKKTDKPKKITSFQDILDASTPSEIKEPEKDPLEGLYEYEIPIANWRPHEGQPNTVDNILKLEDDSWWEKFSSDFGKSFVTGSAQMQDLAGGAFVYAGLEDFGNDIRANAAVTIKDNYVAGLYKEFEWADLIDSEFWSSKFPAMIPSMVTLIPLSFIGGAGGAALTARLIAGRTMTIGAQKLAVGVGSSVAAAIASRPAESAMEAMGTFNQLIDEGYSNEEAGEAAARTFKSNMLLIGMDAAQYALAMGKLNPLLRNNFMKRIITSRTGNAAKEAVEFTVASTSEGVEEVLQNYFTELGIASAHGDIDPSLLDAIRLSSPEHKEAFALGTIGGVGFQIGGKIAQKLSPGDVNRIIDEQEEAYNEKIFKTEDVRKDGKPGEPASVQYYDSPTIPGNFTVAIYDINGIPLENIPANSHDQAKEFFDAAVENIKAFVPEPGVPGSEEVTVDAKEVTADSKPVTVDAKEVTEQLETIKTEITDALTSEDDIPLSHPSLYNNLVKDREATKRVLDELEAAGQIVVDGKTVKRGEKFAKSPVEQETKKLEKAEDKLQDTDTTGHGIRIGGIKADEMPMLDKMIEQTITDGIEKGRTKVEIHAKINRLLQQSEMYVIESNELGAYIKNRMEDGPEIGNNKQPFGIWRKGETGAEEQPGAKVEKPVEQANINEAEKATGFRIIDKYNDVDEAYNQQKADGYEQVAALWEDGLKDLSDPEDFHGKQIVQFKKDGREVVIVKLKRPPGKRGLYKNRDDKWQKEPVYSYWLQVEKKKSIEKPKLKKQAKAPKEALPEFKIGDKVAYRKPRGKSGGFFEKVHIGSVTSVNTLDGKVDSYVVESEYTLKPGDVSVPAKTQALRDFHKAWEAIQDKDERRELKLDLKEIDAKAKEHAEMFFADQEEAVNLLEALQKGAISDKDFAIAHSKFFKDDVIPRMEKRIGITGLDNPVTRAQSAEVIHNYINQALEEDADIIDPGQEEDPELDDAITFFDNIGKEEDLFDEAFDDESLGDKDKAGDKGPTEEQKKTSAEDTGKTDTEEGEGKQAVGPTKEQHPHKFITIYENTKENRDKDRLISSLAGNRNKEYRRDIMSAISGKKVALSQAGVTNLQRAIDEYLKDKAPKKKITRKGQSPEEKAAKKIARNRDKLISVFGEDALEGIETIILDVVDIYPYKSFVTESKGSDKHVTKVIGASKANEGEFYQLDHDGSIFLKGNFSTFPAKPDEVRATFGKAEGDEWEAVIAKTKKPKKKIEKKITKKARTVEEVQKEISEVNKQLSQAERKRDQITERSKEAGQGGLFGAKADQEGLFGRDDFTDAMKDAKDTIHSLKNKLHDLSSEVEKIGSDETGDLFEKPKKKIERKTDESTVTINGQTLSNKLVSVFESIKGVAKGYLDNSFRKISFGDASSLTDSFRNIYGKDATFKEMFSEFHKIFGSLGIGKGIQEEGGGRSSGITAKDMVNATRHYLDAIAKKEAPKKQTEHPDIGKTVTIPKYRSMAGITVHGYIGKVLEHTPATRSVPYDYFEIEVIGPIPGNKVAIKEEDRVFEPGETTSVRVDSVVLPETESAKKKIVKKKSPAELKAEKEAFKLSGEYNSEKEFRAAIRAFEKGMNYTLDYSYPTNKNGNNVFADIKGDEGIIKLWGPINTEGNTRGIEVSIPIEFENGKIIISEDFQWTHILRFVKPDKFERTAAQGLGGAEYGERRTVIDANIDANTTAKELAGIIKKEISPQKKIEKKVSDKEQETYEYEKAKWDDLIARNGQKAVARITSYLASKAIGVPEGVTAEQHRKDTHFTKAYNYLKELVNKHKEEAPKKRIEKKQGAYKYRLTQRPPSIGTHPDGSIGDAVEVKVGNRTHWILTYPNVLSDEVLRKYEMVPDYDKSIEGNVYQRRGLSLKVLEVKDGEVFVEYFYDAKEKTQPKTLSYLQLFQELNSDFKKVVEAPEVAPKKKIERKKTEAQESTTDILKANKLEIIEKESKKGNTYWVVTGEGTFQHKDLIKKLGSKKFNRFLKGWLFFDANPKQKLINELSGTDGATVEPGAKSSPEDTSDSRADTQKVDRAERDRIKGIRSEQDARSDESRIADDLQKYVSPGTISLINKGKEFGIPQKVLDEQIEDVALINRAYQAGKPLFLLANEAGTGKTFVLGGAIRELKAAGVKDITYVTMSQDLIKQIKNDLQEYGIDDINFVTYSKLSSYSPDKIGAIIFDESQNVKNVASGRGKAAVELIKEHKPFTIHTSATPFENPVEAGYFEATGIFDEAGGFLDWAKAYGAAVRKQKYYDYAAGKKVVIETPYWAGGHVKDGQAARTWFFRQGIMTQRPMQIPPAMVDVTFKKVTVDKKWVDLYNSITDALDDTQHLYSKEGENPDPMLFMQIGAYKTNLQKRILESSKVEEGIKRAKEHLSDGKSVVLFVETKAQRSFDAADISAIMTRFNQTKQKGDKPPYSKVVHAVAESLLNAGIDSFTLNATEEMIKDGLGTDNVGIYTGSVTNAKAQKNLQEWRAQKKKVLVATMAKGGTGLSLHDTEGDRPTAQININLPWKATGVDQVSGRVARYGIQSKANIEWLFANNIDFDKSLSSKVGRRMSDMGAIVKGVDLSSAQVLSDFDFEDTKIQRTEAAKKVQAGEKESVEEMYDRAHKMEQHRSKADDTSGGFFQTPLPVSLVMSRISGLREGDSLLEPSAGHGALLKFIPPGINITAVEQRLDNFAVLQKAFSKHNLIMGDFAGTDAGIHDVILMNPPFERIAGKGWQDAAHVRKAYDKHLKEGGRLISIMGEGSFFRQDKQSTEFREWLEEVGATVIKLPEGAFKKSGTNIRTRMVVIDKTDNGYYSEHDLENMEDIRDIEDWIPEKAASTIRPGVSEDIASYTVDQTRTPAFKKWFGDSKVVDKDGKPLVVYHGTKNRFNVFDVHGERAFDEDGYTTGETNSGPDPTAFIGSHFGDKRVGKQFSRGLYANKNTPGIGRVMAIYLSLQNPKTLSSIELEDRVITQTMLKPEFDDWWMEAGAEEYGKDPEHDSLSDNIDIDTKGDIVKSFYNYINEWWDEEMVYSVAHDVGFTIRENYKSQGYDGIIYENDIEGGTSYIAFEPTQIKSATSNLGTFSPTNPSIIKEPTATFTADQTETAAFKKWFGKSKMVGADGKPLVTYHGTNSQFEEFRSDVGHSNDRGFYGRGFYFTFNTDPLWQRLSKGEAAYYGGNVMETYLKIENPFDISSLETYKGKSVRAMGYQSMVFLKNIAEQFPSVAKGITLRKLGKYDRNDDSYAVTEVGADVIPGLFKKYENDVIVKGVESFGELTSKTAYIGSKSEKISTTLKSGKVHSWISNDDLGRYDKDSSDNDVRLYAIIDAIEKYDGISVDYHPEGYMTRYPSITEAIKAKGHDGILQSMSGDEAVVFSPDQIKSATGNTGEFSQTDPNITREPITTYQVDQTQTAAFKKWFGNGIITNPDGSPKVMYHGTTASDFVTFARNSWVGDSNVANAFAGFSPRDTSRVYPLYTNIKKPFDFGELVDDVSQHVPQKDLINFLEEKLGKAPKAVLDGFNELEEDSDFPGGDSLYQYFDVRFDLPDNPAIQSMFDWIESKGYDSILAPEGFGELNQIENTYMVFNPTSLKSATGNIGTFSQADPNITKEPLAAYKTPTNQTRTSAFNKWFNNSEVIDINGDPLVVYHGTKHSFDRFDNFPAYFTPEPDVSGFYSNREDNLLGSNIVPVYLSIKKPLHISNDYQEHFEGLGTSTDSDSFFTMLESVLGDKIPQDIQDDIIADSPRFLADDRRRPIYEYIDENQTLIDYLEAKGYDGIIANEGIFEDLDDTVFIVFDPTQIKSATGNVGTFSRTNPSMISETQETYTTTKGEKIQFKAASSQMDVFKGIPKVKPTKQILSPSRRKRIKEKGEFSALELKYNKFRKLQYFQDVETITSNEDVAFIFRQLESEGIEHAYLAGIDGKGKSQILHIASGGLGSAHIYLDLIHDFIDRFGIKKLWFVHNHPSGALHASSGDVSMFREIKGSLKGRDVEFGDGIILNIKHGKYGVFTTDTKSKSKGDLITRKPLKPVKLTVYEFGRRVFNKNVNFDELTTVRSPVDVAKYLSATRFSSGDKLQVLILSGRATITARAILTADQTKPQEIINELNILIGRYGARGFVLVSNRSIEKASPVIQQLSNNFRGPEYDEPFMFDYVAVGTNPELLLTDFRSARAIGEMIIDEPTAPFRISKRKPSGKVSEPISSISEEDSAVEEEPEPKERHVLTDADNEFLTDKYEQIKDKWFGERDVREVQVNNKTIELQRRIQGTVERGPKLQLFKFEKKWQMVDKAIHVYIDTKRNPANLEEFFPALTEEQQEIVTLSQNLTAEQKAIARDIEREYDKTGIEAMSAGLIRNVLDNYVSRVWNLEGKPGSEYFRKFGLKTRHSKQRVLDTILEGWARGLELKVEGATSNLEVLKIEILNAKENKKLVDAGFKAKAPDGDPLFSTRHLNGYKMIDHPGFTRWGYAGTIEIEPLEANLSKISEAKADEDGVYSKPIEKLIHVVTEALMARGMSEGEATVAVKKIQQAENKKDAVDSQINELKVDEAEKIITGVEFKRFLSNDLIVTPEGTILKRKRVYAPEDIANNMNNILGSSKLKDVPIVGVPLDKIAKFNAITKAMILQTSLFHHFAFTRSFLFGGAVGIKDINVVKAYKTGLKAIEAMGPDIELLVRNGLTLGRRQDWEEMYLQQKTAIGSLLDKNKVTKAVKDRVLAIQEWQARGLFNRYGAGLKAKAALLELQHTYKTKPNLSPNERAKYVAGLVNADFGGLHLQRMGRNPTSQAIFRLFFLAPDWTESNVMTMVKAIKAGSRAERSMYRRFWMRAATRAVGLTMATNLLLSLWDYDDDDDKRSVLEKFNRRFKRAWSRGYLRFLEADITPVYRALGGSKEKISYFSILGHFKDPIKFVLHPFRSAHHKGSVVYRIGHEAIVGTDWRGHQFTTIDEVLGIDTDKGFYKTTSKDGGYKRGDPKNGKLKGQLTKYSRRGQSVEYKQLPSYVISQARGITPIQVQNFISYMTGEADGFAALTKSMGLNVIVSRDIYDGEPPEEKAGAQKKIIKK